MAMTKPKPLEQVCAVARLSHLNLRTKEAYSDWIRPQNFQRVFLNSKLIGLNHYALEVHSGLVS